MNRRGVRAFALGVLFAASAIGSYYFYFNKGETVPSAKKQLEDNGYIVLSANEYKTLKSSVAKKTGESGSAKKTAGHRTVPAAPSQPAKTQKNATEKKVYTIQLDIKAGMNTEEVSHVLAEQKIIPDEHEFGQFLIDQDYQSKLQLGTFELTSDMSYDQMAKIITKQ